LVLTLVGGNGATGWEIEDWVITSRANVPCTVEGTPTARFVADSGLVVLESKDGQGQSETVLLPPDLPVAQPGEQVTRGHAWVDFWFLNGCRPFDSPVTLVVTIPGSGDVEVWRHIANYRPPGRCDSPESPPIVVAQPIMDGIY
jgi:hypothetical protein